MGVYSEHNTQRPHTSSSFECQWEDNTKETTDDYFAYPIDVVLTAR